MIANMLEGMEHEEAARLAELSRSVAYEWHNRYEEDDIDRSRVVPSAAARPPPFAAKKSIPASSVPQTWYAYLSTLPHLGFTGSRYNTATSMKKPRSTSLGPLI